MTRSQLTLRLAAAGAAALLLAGCATLHVRSYVQPGADFERYRTYGWGAPDTFTTGDPRLDGNTFFRDRLQAGVDARLASRGLEQADAGAADLLLHYHMNITQRIDVNEIDEKVRLLQRLPAGRVRRRDTDAGSHRRQHWPARLARMGGTEHRGRVRPAGLDGAAD